MQDTYSGPYACQKKYPAVTNPIPATIRRIHFWFTRLL